MSGALGALSGPFHGGAPARVFDMLDAIGTPDNAEPWLRHAIEHGDKLMGFGHRIYKTVDPRSQLLHEVARELHSERVEFSEIVEKTAVELLAELKPGRELYANVEFYAGVVLEAAGPAAGDVQRRPSPAAGSSAGWPTCWSRSAITAYSGRWRITTGRRRRASSRRPGSPASPEPASAPSGGNGRRRAAVCAPARLHCSSSIRQYGYSLIWLPI